MEGNGEAGTVFATEAVEGRFEVVHSPWKGIEGAVGVQLSHREFAAIGEEAFVQPVDTETLGVFYVGQGAVGETHLEAGFRYEHVEHDPTDGRSRQYDLAAGSFGVTRSFADYWTVRGLVDYSNRAPVAEELYSDGPHLATQSFEIGDDSLNRERAANVSVSIGYERERFRWSLAAYQTQFDDFIYEQATGDTLDELPVLLWQQQDADFAGAEFEVAWDALDWHSGQLTFSASAESVRARFKDGENRRLPRIPPQRWRLGALLNWDNWLAEVSWRDVDSQTDVAPGELVTEGFEDLRVHLAYEIKRQQSTFEIFLTGRNLTDDEQRYHSSFIKDFAPQPGRTIEAGVVFRL